MTIAGLFPYVVPMLLLVLTAASAGVFARSGTLARTVDVLQRMIGSYEQALKLAEHTAANAVAESQSKDQRIAELEEAAASSTIERLQLRRKLQECRDQRLKGGDHGH